MKHLTVSEVAARTGLTRAAVLDALNAGNVPGAQRLPGRAWAIPADALTHVTPAVTDTAGATATKHPDEGFGEHPTAPRLRELVEAARRVERALDPVSTRSARALASSVWRHVEAGSRHDVDRDGVCRHDGWAWPCPDYLDASSAVLEAVAVVLEGGSA